MRGGTSAAFPTIGRTIRPMKASETPDEATISSIELTRNSAQMATTAVDPSNNKTEMSGVISAYSVSSSSSSEV